MSKNIKINHEIIDKLSLVREFLMALYEGRRPYKDRIVFISNTLDDVLSELKVNMVQKELG